MKGLLKKLFKVFNVEVRHVNNRSAVANLSPVEEKRKIISSKYYEYMGINDFSETDIDTVLDLEAYTMTGPERMWSLLRAIEYIVKNDIPGDIVECGVWRGGSMMIVANTLMRLGDTKRHLYLYDTFEGMSEPTADDISYDNKNATDLLNETATNKLSGDNIWCFASLEDVEANLAKTGYDAEKIHFIKGKVEDTIPQYLPGNKIALLRLDTDWYESTKHELDHLYPLLSSKGVLIIDDYGQWGGSRKAVDEYFENNNPSLFFNRVDYTCRLAING